MFGYDSKIDGSALKLWKTFDFCARILCNVQTMWGHPGITYYQSLLSIEGGGSKAGSLKNMILR